MSAHRLILLACLVAINCFGPKSVSEAAAATIEVKKINDELDLIVIEGQIEYRDDVEFRLKTFDIKKAIVAFNSPGGNLDAGLSIGKQIRLSCYATLIGAKLCVSACALVVQEQ